MTNVAINGLGRIGRSVLKIVMATPELNLVAANDIAPSDSAAYLLKYDTVYGRYEQPVETTADGHLKIGNHRLQLLGERDPARLPWRSLNVDIVFECTGRSPDGRTSIITSMQARGTSFYRRPRETMALKRSCTE